MCTSRIQPNLGTISIPVWEVVGFKSTSPSSNYFVILAHRRLLQYSHPYPLTCTQSMYPGPRIQAMSRCEHQDRMPLTALIRFRIIEQRGLG